MKIINLIENTPGMPGCIFAHGLSFYIETKKHKLLLDLGPSEDTLKNAEALGIDLSKVDTVILSHGHYDHSGGIMPFTKINNSAKIYMQSLAAGEYYADDGPDAPERFRYIGIDKDISKLPQVTFIDGDYMIDDELELFTVKNRTHDLPFTNKRLLIKREDGFVSDDFSHEHFLVINEMGKQVLLSGCAHNGILSILDAYKTKYGRMPDAVISGFHLMKKTEYSVLQTEEIKNIARELSVFPIRFFTCHCTGLPAFEIMKDIMGDKLIYVHSGEEINDL
ncbi:MAG: MBL fold metallo-hydrolase [Lachnospiraceae bacterium]|nr:MBL fold metallo-hydrolase [Lachnospiraceae bacterium]